MIFPNVLGNYYSFQNAEFFANGLQFAGIKAINYKDNLSRQHVRGTAMQPLGMTQGRYTANGDCEMYMDAFQLLIASLGPGYRQVPIFATVTWGPNVGLALPFIIDEIPGFTIGEIDGSHSEGEEAMTRKFTMHIPGQILWGLIPSVLEPQILAAVA